MPHPEGVARSSGASTRFAQVSAAGPIAEVHIGSPGEDGSPAHIAEFRIEKRRCWSAISARVVDRTAGQAISRSDCYRLTYLLTDFQGTMEEDGRLEWECQLRRGNFVFRPPDMILRSNLTAGRYIQILQNRDTYANLTSEMVRGGVADLAPSYDLHDPLVSQLTLTIADEITGGVLDTILVDSLNTALAVQLVRLCGDPAAVRLPSSNGLSRERLNQIYEYVEAHLDHRLSLSDLAAVSRLSPYHFSRSFKQAVGMGPHRYITQRRLDRAKTLMRRTNLPLAFIAQETGFVDQSHFTSVFRREVGVTPGHYRTR